MAIWPVRQAKNSSAPHRRCFAGLCIALIGWACGRADDAPQTLTRTHLENLPTPAPSAPGNDDAGAVAPAGASCSGPECPGCPAATLEFSGGQPSWSRNPATGECCRYDDRVAAPEHWPSFDTEAACQSDCRCSVLDGLNEIVGVNGTDYIYATERTSLDCRCSKESCPSTPAQAEQRLCEAFGAAQRREGCGRVFVVFGGGNYSNGWVFEQSLPSTGAAAVSPRLVGGYESSDAPGQCGTYGWVAGSEFDCDSAAVCQVCGESAEAPVAPCQ